MSNHRGVSSQLRGPDSYRPAFAVLLLALLACNPLLAQQEDEDSRSTPYPLRPLDSVYSAESPVPATAPRSGELQGYLITGAGTDSSIASASELGVSSIPLGDLRLAPDAGKISDAFTTLGAGVGYSKAFTDDSALRVSADYRLDDAYSTDTFDAARLSGELGYAHLLSGLQLSYGARAQLLEIGDEEFLRSGSLITSLRRNSDGGWSQALSGGVTLLRYNERPNAEVVPYEASQWQVSGELGRRNGSFDHNLSLYYGGEQGRGSSTSQTAGNFYGLAFSEQFRFRPGHIPYLKVSLHYRETPAALAGTAESVDNNSISTSMGWIWQANRNINVTTDLTYTDNQSTLESFVFERVRLQTGLRYEF